MFYLVRRDNERTNNEDYYAPMLKTFKQVDMDVKPCFRC